MNTGDLVAFRTNHDTIADGLDEAEGVVVEVGEDGSLTLTVHGARVSAREDEVYVITEADERPDCACARLPHAFWCADPFHGLA